MLSKTSKISSIRQCGEHWHSHHRIILMRSGYNCSSSAYSNITGRHIRATTTMPRNYGHIINTAPAILQYRFSTSTGPKTDFGFQQVDADEKERLVRDVFSKVATRYDIMNDMMSVGIHRLWKDELIDMINFPFASKLNPNMVPRHLDVAGGTGDIAFRSVKEILRNYSNIDMTAKEEHLKQVIVCDINPDMLQVGRYRAPKILGEKDSSMVGFKEGNAESLPFADDSFDIYTIAFGLRNVTNKDAALREAYRVLRKGGRLLVLEFSHLTNPALQYLYDQYSFSVIPKLGEYIANDKDSYQYLVESIRKFPKQEELKSMIADAGFKSSSYRNLTFGICAIHSGYKK